MKILVIEDEFQLRALNKRLLQSMGHDPVLCESAEKGLEELEKESFPLILLDMMLPGMNGLDFSRKIRSMPHGGDPYILAVTGWADDRLPSILEAGANDYMQKPLHVARFKIRIQIAEKVIQTIQERKHYQAMMHSMVTHEVLEHTLNGFLRIVTNVLSNAAPEVFGRTMRITHIAEECAKNIGLPIDWELTAAAMLCQIGCVTIPPEIVQKAWSPQPLNSSETQLFQTHIKNGADMLDSVPRMEKVGRIMLYQEKHYDGSGFPKDDVAGEAIPPESRLLKIALDLDRLYSMGLSRNGAFAELSTRKGWYDQKLLNILQDTPCCLATAPDTRRVWVNQLKDGMILAENVMSQTNALLAIKGKTITPTIRKQLTNFSTNFHIRQPIEVIEPLSVASEDA